MDHTSVQIAKDDPIRKDIQKMPIRKGSILIWNSRLPHGTFPNNSSNFRMIQYMKMGFANDPAIEPSYFGLESIPKDLTPLGKKLLGVEPWTDEEDDPQSKSSSNKN